MALNSGPALTPLICERIPNSNSEVIGSKVLQFCPHAKTTKDIFHSLVRAPPPTSLLMHANIISG